jgi:CheY-like chemotaxis protein
MRNNMAINSTARKRVLVVDDEPDVLIYLSRILQDNGFNATRAADGEQAFQAVEKERPDLITLDLSMPETTGVKFYRMIKSRPDLSTIPVIFVTGITGPGGPRDTERFYSTRRQVPPPDGFIAKPIDPQELLELVRKLTTGERQPLEAASTKL